MTTNSDRKDANVGFRVPASLKDAFWSKYSDDPSGKLRELMKMAVSDEFTGNKKIEQLKKKVEDLRNRKQSVEHDLEDKKRKIDEIESKINVIEQEIDKKTKLQDSKKDKKKKLLNTTFNQLANGGNDLRPVKKKTLEYDVEKAKYNGVQIDSVDEWKSLLAEKYEEEFNEELNHIPVKIKENGREKIKKLEVNNG
ncbi:MAG: coiled-coil domain-containing protein [Petrotogales bacterium]